MPLQKIPTFSWGGVDSHSNPANYPTDRFMRCINWLPKPSGVLRLRDGFTAPAMSAVDGTLPIHTAMFFELLDGTPFIIFGQDDPNNSIKAINLDTGAVTVISSAAVKIATGKPWGTYRANNKSLISNGIGNVPLVFQYDGTTMREAGIRAPLTSEVATVTVAQDTVDAGNFSPTVLSGYQFYLSFYNPTTGDVGNAVPIGPRVPITQANASVKISLLPDLSVAAAVGNLPNGSGGFIDPNGSLGEWFCLFGRTADGGQVASPCTDANGNWLITKTSNVLNTVVISSSATDPDHEMPTRNTLMSGFDKFASVLGRVFMAKAGSFNVQYTPTAADSPTGDWTGNPEVCAPADNLIPFPAAEPVTSLQSYNFSAWMFTRNYMAIWSEFLNGVTGNTNPWQGVWPVGCAGQRAFCVTQHGPYWLSGNKELMTWADSGPVPVSGEYQRALLTKIADANMSSVEISYFRDPENEIDRLYVLGKDTNNNPVIVVHDFLLVDERSIYGQAYSFSYTGIAPKTFVGAGSSPNVPVTDSSGKQRLWCGAGDGKFYQLEDGNSDNGQEYSADAIQLFGLGNQNALLAEIEWQADENTTLSAGFKLDQQIDDLLPLVGKSFDEHNYRTIFAIPKEERYLMLRVQLASHHADGNFLPTDPPFMPVNVYGSVLTATVKMGAPRPEGR